MTHKLTFTDALQRLRHHGISGHEVYFIDLVLLCEMSWADGISQDAEREIIYDYLYHHVDSINRLAGCKVLEYEEAQDFLSRYLDEPPTAEVCEEIRNLIQTVRLLNRDEDVADKIRFDILNACIDIAASSVTKYPYGACERFTIEEKEYYHQLVEILKKRPPESI